MVPILMLLLYLVAEGGAYFYARYEPDSSELSYRFGSVVFAPSHYIDRCIDRDPRRYYQIPFLSGLLVARDEYRTWCAVQSGKLRCGGGD